MLAGNILALWQDNIKRLLAYSSIAHMGYLLSTLLVAEQFQLIAASYYIAAYFITILIAFGCVSILTTEDQETQDIHQFRGLFWRRPWLSALFIFSLLSLAGIPFTGGFFGKFYVLSACINSSLWFIAVMIVLTSTIGIFYYLRVVSYMMTTVESPGFHAARAVSFVEHIALSVLTAFLFWLGIYPATLIQWVERVLLQS
jgi:NADH-quinone oxidoreductase subunit N